MDRHGDATLPHDDASSRVGHDAGPQRKLPRVALACSRCKRRKQRCDGVHPACTSCTRTSTECVYERSLRRRYPGGKSLYINALEERIAFLESRLPMHGEDCLLAPTISRFDEDHGTAARAKSQAWNTTRRPSTASSDSLLTDEDEQSSLVDGVAYLSLCASGITDTAPEPFYVGSSSGATIARLIQSSVFKSTRSRLVGNAGLHQLPDVLRPPTPRAGNPKNDAPSFAAVDHATHDFPPPAQAQALFSVYFDRLHVRFPLLDRRLYTSLFEKQWQHAGLSVTERSIMHLIYATSARFIQLMKQNFDVDPEKHFAAAIQDMDYILEQHNVATVQFLAMLAIYSSRSPYGAGSWSQVRYAITLCIELGLHRKQSPQSHEDVEIRRRVFWTCYCLDRMTTMTLGRTFAISDRDINADFPDQSPNYWHLTADPSTGSGKWPNVAQFAHLIRLHQLQSEVFRTVWRVDKAILRSSTGNEDREKLDRKVQQIKMRLDEWLESVPPTNDNMKERVWMYDPELACNDSLDYFQLHYHKTLLSLYTALIPTLPTSDPRFLCATKSAATVCMTYKSLNAHKTLSYTIIALHSCFIAGLTLIYCLWRDPGLFSYSSLEATQACSLCLTIFGEKWPGAVKYRDIFDAISGSLLKSIVEDGGVSSKRRRDRPSCPPLSMEAQLPRQQQQQHERLFPGQGMGFTNQYMTGNDVATSDENGDAIYSAVKDAFMECSGEAQRGWHGWKMFNEMMQSDMATAPIALGTEGPGSIQNTAWQSFCAQGDEWEWETGL